MTNNSIKRINLYKYNTLYNEKEERATAIKEYIEIEFEKGKTIRLDVTNGIDFTDKNYIKIISKGKEKNLFISEIAKCEERSQS